MGFRHFAGIAVVTAMLSAPAALPALALGDGPAIASDWAELDVPQDECFARGEAAIRRTGFGEIERSKYSRFGSREDYTIAVRCVAEKKVVLFLAAGRDRGRTQALQIDVHRNYLKGP
jgi:hypothetical protein